MSEKLATFRFMLAILVCGGVVGFAISIPWILWGGWAGIPSVSLGLVGETALLSFRGEKLFAALDEWAHK